MINYAIIVRVLGILLLIIGMLMWTGIPFSWYFESDDLIALFWSGFICITTGGMMWLLKLRNDRSVRKREGYLIVALGWLTMSLFGMLPYLLSGVIPGVPSAIFETVSGMTTTGASVLTDIEATRFGLTKTISWAGGTSATGDRIIRLENLDFENFRINFRAF